MTGGQAGTLPLYGVCDSCGSPDGVAFRHTTGSNAVEHYCPRCAQRYALYSAAYAQLELQVRDMVAAWLSVWGTLPGVVDLGEQLSQIGHALQRDYQAGTFPPEGVQPFRCAA